MLQLPLWLPDTDLWVELGYGLGQIGDADVSVSLGVGNEQYSSNGDPKLALLGINASAVITLLLTRSMLSVKLTWLL